MTIGRGRSSLTMPRNGSRFSGGFDRHRWADRRFFFFNDTATTEIYTLSLHDALPISPSLSVKARPSAGATRRSRKREGVAAMPETLSGDALSFRVKATELNMAWSWSAVT